MERKGEIDLPKECIKGFVWTPCDCNHWGRLTACQWITVARRITNPFIHSFGRLISPFLSNSWLLCFVSPDHLPIFFKSSPNLFLILSSFSFSISHWIERGLQRNKGRDLYQYHSTLQTLLYRIRWLFWFYITCSFLIQRCLFVLLSHSNNHFWIWSK